MVLGCLISACIILWGRRNRRRHQMSLPLPVQSPSPPPTETQTQTHQYPPSRPAQDRVRFEPNNLDLEANLHPEESEDVLTPLPRRGRRARRQRTRAAYTEVSISHDVCHSTTNISSQPPLPPPTRPLPSRPLHNAQDYLPPAGRPDPFASSVGHFVRVGALRY